MTLLELLSELFFFPADEENPLNQNPTDFKELEHLKRHNKDSTLSTCSR